MNEHSKPVQLALIVIAAVAIMGMLLAFTGCQTTNAAFRDVKWLAEQGVDFTQKGADAQRRQSIAFGIRDRNLIMSQGQQVYAELNQ